MELIQLCLIGQPFIFCWHARWAQDGHWMMGLLAEEPCASWLSDVMKELPFLCKTRNERQLIKETQNSRHVLRRRHWGMYQ